MVSVAARRWLAPLIQRADAGPVRLPEDGSATVRFKTPRRPRQEMRLEINAPAEGVSIGDAELLPDGFAFQVKVEGDAAKAGFADNLIVEAFVNMKNVRANARNEKAAKAAEQDRWVSIGTLPAVPYVVVKP